VSEALPPGAPPETAGLQLVLHGVRLGSADDAAAIVAATVVLGAVYVALEARQATPVR